MRKSPYFLMSPGSVRILGAIIVSLVVQLMPAQIFEAPRAVAKI
jgi:hypothetical protein